LLHIFQSNRLELLADELARTLKADAAHPLEPRTVIVQERGIARWLSFALAERMGIAANIEFPFPAGTVWSLFARVLSDVPRESPFDTEVLVWRFMKLLDSPAALEHPRLKQALDGADARRLHELAKRLAAVFERYIVYRPDWIKAWSEERLLGLGADESWQKAFWRELRAELRPEHREHPMERFFAALEQDLAARAALPPTLHLFAVQALPPMYMDIFRRLGNWADVHLYALNPCKEHWGEIVRRREQALRAAEAGEGVDLHFEVGNDLLASLGRHGRAFFDALSGEQAQERWADNPQPTQLARVQNDILYLREPDREAPPATDRSLQVHVCHSATREVEVLHDRLLDAFERDPSLRPGDVLVLVPRIEDYAPAIDAVFATAPLDRRLPFAIADRAAGMRSVSRSIAAFLRMHETRLEAEPVLSLLEHPAVARRFDLVADDLPLLREWVRESGIRWGYDENSRVALALPETREHSWSAGLDRMLLGYAMPEPVLFGGVLPHEGIEGSAAALLGNLKSFVDDLAALVGEAPALRRLPQWQSWTERLLARFHAFDEEEEGEAQALRSAMTTLVARAHAAGFNRTVPLEVWRAELDGLWEALPHGEAFLSGGISFAALRSLRAVPARFIAVLGMNGGHFPRQAARQGFDLMEEDGRAGDRIAREEDRYAFLEAVLAARERLHLSYTGRSQRDNAQIPPSPVLEELLETLRRGGLMPGADAWRNTMIEHRLQPFSPRYFDGQDPNLYSYAGEYAPPSIRAEPPAFAIAAVAPPEETAAPRIEALQEFLRNPAKFFLLRTLGVRLAKDEQALEDSEPFALEGLADWSLCEAVLAHRLEGIAAGESLALARAAGHLAHGAYGDAWHARALARVEPIAAAVRKSGSLQRRAYAFEFQGAMVDGSLDGFSSAGRIVWQPGELRDRQLLGHWIAHLAMNASGIASPTLVHALGEDKAAAVWHLAPVADAHAQLSALFALMRAGSQEPLPFFPRSSRAYAKARGEGADEARALAQARNCWTRNERTKAQGEGDDAYMALAFRGREAFAGRFAELATAVWAPLEEALQND
jgi:exodeoxyribonuclease V gamma subunit